MFVIGRSINGISLNGWEYVLSGKDGDVMIYDAKEDALEFLKCNTGKTETSLYFEEEYGAHILKVGVDVEVVDIKENGLLSFDCA